jgi:hypothetical protein
MPRLLYGGGSLLRWAAREGGLVSRNSMIVAEMQATRLPFNEACSL